MGYIMISYVYMLDKMIIQLVMAVMAVSIIINLTSV